VSRSRFRWVNFTVPKVSFQYGRFGSAARAADLLHIVDVKVNEVTERANPEGRSRFR
jgi:hypothetical protein